MSSAAPQSNEHTGARSTGPPVTPVGEHRHSKQPGAAGRPELEPKPPTPPCYVVAVRGGDTCERRPVSTAGELQAQISELVSRGPQVAPGATGVLIAASGKQVRGVEGAARPLIIIYGLPAAFVPILLDGPLDMDPAFVEAHAAGTSYRPLGVRRRRGANAAKYAHWDYPELVAGYWQAVAEEESCTGFEQRSAGSGISGGLVDLARQAVVRPVSNSDKGLAAMFSRASLWVSEDVDVLFLDKPRWGEGGPLIKARRVGRAAGNIAMASQKRQPNVDGTKGDSVAVAQWKGEEIPSLESILQDSLAIADKDSGVVQLLEETAYEQWLELFEVLTPRRRVVKPERIPLEWQIMRALERNFDMAKKAARSHNGTGAAGSCGVSPDDWRGLIQRLRTRAEVLAATSPCVAHKKTEKTASGAPFHTERMTYIPRHRSEAQDKPSPQPGSDDNQRALDRVTYLGGILLPFSLVSGVLSMNEGFEPGQPLFWVFWVATIPLALFTVLVIYADKLRQVEVWAEVLDPSSASDSESDQGSTKSGGGDKVQETEKGKRNPAPAFGISKYNRPQQPEAVTYSAGGDVVIDIGTPTPEIQQISAGSPGPHREGQRTDSDQDQDQDQDQEESSSDEDTAEEVALPAGGARYRPGWEKKQLGWKGAAMCILRMRKPLLALDGIPLAAGEGQGDD